LTLKHDNLLSNFAFNLNLRLYTEEFDAGPIALEAAGGLTLLISSARL